MTDSADSFGDKATPDSGIDCDSAPDANEETAVKCAAVHTASDTLGNQSS